MTERNLEDLDFSEDIKIDKYKLDFELINGPEIRHDWSKAHVEAIKQKQKAKARIELVSAEVDEDIRTNWETFNFDKKPTEAAIKQAIIKSEQYQEVMDKFIETVGDAKMLEHSIEEFDQKHDNLGRMIKIYLTGYYSESTKIHDDIDEKKLSDQQTKNIQKKLDKMAKKKLAKKKLKKGK